MDGSTFSYVGYGLGIRSFLPLPELVAAETATDVRVRLGRVEYSPLDSADASAHFCHADGETCFGHKEVGAFLVRGGREIVVDPVPGVDERALRLFLLGPAMGLLLHQRGLLLLHASAVAVNGGAVAILGEKGRGKSTTAAAMHAKGHGVVADDVVALDVDGEGRPTVLPGFPQLKLWPDAAAALGIVPEELPRVHPHFEKRARRVSNGFQQSPLPLLRIYVLDEGDGQEIEALETQAAFVELLRHSYVARFARLLEITGTTAIHFRQCVRLVGQVPVRRLKRQRSLSALPFLVELVENDLALLKHPSRF